MFGYVITKLSQKKKKKGGELTSNLNAKCVTNIMINKNTL